MPRHAIAISPPIRRRKKTNKGNILSPLLNIALQPLNSLDPVTDAAEKLYPTMQTTPAQEPVAPTNTAKQASLNSYPESCDHLVGRPFPTCELPLQAAEDPQVDGKFFLSTGDHSDYYNSYG